MNMIREMRLLKARILQLERLVEGHLDPINRDKLKKASILDIQKIVAKVSSIGLQHIIGNGKRARQKIAEVRLLGMVLCERHTLSPTQHIAEAFGLSDHSNVTYARKRWKNLSESHLELKALEDQCEQLIRMRFYPDQNKRSTH